CVAALVICFCSCAVVRRQPAPDPFATGSSTATGNSSGASASATATRQPVSSNHSAIRPVSYTTEGAVPTQLSNAPVSVSAPGRVRISANDVQQVAAEVPYDIPGGTSAATCCTSFALMRTRPGALTETGALLSWVGTAPSVV